MTEAQAAAARMKALKTGDFPDWKQVKADIACLVAFVEADRQAGAGMTVPSEALVEKVARALCNEGSRALSWTRYRNYWERLARAALTSISDGEAEKGPANGQG